MLATSGCSGSDPEPDASASPDTVTMSATPSPTTPDPTVPIATSQAAGIPTAKPSPATTPDPTTLNASVLITLATVDPDTGGMLLGGYVTGVMEDGGDCQYIVTSSASGSSLTIHKDGVENNGTTSCGSTTVSASRVPAGSYMVVLRYANDIGAVVSDAVTVDIP